MLPGVWHADGVLVWLFPRRVGEQGHVMADLGQSSPLLAMWYKAGAAADVLLAVSALCGGRHKWRATTSSVEQHS